ncbi:MAG TPA: HAMP domain-containing sensor histidine kinase [Candidatus Deferrimicrobium sp.]|nr:HAMP domain-containing sensor histidine kinase [Candidatus Deferrimicrobium sp.]
MALGLNITRGTARLYIGKSTAFKVFLLVGVAAISAVFIWYTVSVIGKLQTDTRSQVEKYVKMWQLAASSAMSGAELQFIFDEIIVKANFPIIVLDGDRRPIHWRNIAGISPTDTASATRGKLREMAEKMVRQHGEFPLRFGETHVNYFCYGDSKVIRQLTMMPFVEIGIVVAFLIVALIGFQSIRRSEERHIWVGMAKETAHQLGTPISSLLGWAEVAQEKCASEQSAVARGAVRDVIENMKIDIGRLQKVANRFGQIGSTPDLRPFNLNKIVEETIEYFRKRLPFEGKGITLQVNAGQIPEVSLNPELMGWALENLIKNALQAVDSKSGRVEVKTSLSSNGRNAMIEVCDNGTGIPAAAARKIFRPGFTTKKRGWGLGLTLVKRIVEDSHAGRVTLKHSRPGETVFEIQLPLGGRH